VLHHDRSWVVAQERWGTCTDFVKHDAQRVQVTTLISRSAHDLFWRNIERCINLPTTHATRSTSEQFKHARVSDNRFTDGITRDVVFIEQNICWFELTMYHSMLVGIGNSHADRGK